MGLNNAWKSREIGACLNSMKPDPVILIETKVKISKSRAIRNKSGYSWSYADNYLNDDNGRIWILWDESRIKVSYISSSAQYIHYGIYSLNGNLKARCTTLCFQHIRAKEDLMEGYRKSSQTCL